MKNYVCCYFIFICYFIVFVSERERERGRKFMRKIIKKTVKIKPGFVKIEGKHRRKKYFLPNEIKL